MSDIQHPEVHSLRYILYKDTNTDYGKLKIIKTML